MMTVVTSETAGDAALELTDAIVRALTVPDGRSEHLVRDTKQSGLAVRVRDGGGKSYVYLSTRPGQKGTFRVTIGSCRKFTPAAARRQAAILAGQRAQGADLVAARQQTKAAAKAAVRLAVRSKRAALGALIAEDGPY